MLSIRKMTVADIDAGLCLCRQAQWNQIAQDWLRVIALAPEGVIAAEIDGKFCGTGTAVAYGTDTAWIGMILVDQDYRRRGIGSAIMNWLIEHLRGLGVASIKLDASDQGQPVYLKLGFVNERPIWRYQGRTDVPAASMSALPSISSHDWPAVAGMDREVFGAGRLALLKQLSTEGPSAVCRAGGRIKGFGLARPGCVASFLGPVVAEDADTAGGIVRSLLAKAKPGPVFWDILTDNAPAVAMAENAGFTVVRKLVRMYLGRMNPGRTERVYAAAGLELG